MLKLFKQFPGLKQIVNHTPLGVFPTPVERLDGLCSYLGRDNLYIKRDDLSGSLYGGNKVRKLEFLMGEALAGGAVRVITSGGVGSNHALATALYAKQTGLKAAIMLFGQSASDEVRGNLLADYLSGARMHHFDSYEAYVKSMREITDYYSKLDGRSPYIIPAGGSCGLGSLGFVNAALELADQINDGRVPEPAAIYTAFGTMGTAAGLFVGLKVAGLKCRLIGVRVVPTVVADQERFAEMVESICSLLHKADNSFKPEIQPDEFTINDDFLGPGYGITTPESLETIRMFDEFDRIHLDGVYTGKTGAAFIKDVRGKYSQGESVLFWNTKNSRILSKEPAGISYTELPSEFHQYFT